MPFERAFILSAILLAGIAFSSLALAADFSAGMLLLVGAAFLLGAAQNILPIERSHWLFTLRLSRTSWNVLLVAGFVVFWIDLIWVSRDLLAAGVQILVILLINKLLHLQYRRDILQLYAISLMALLSSAAVTTHVWHAPIFAAYLVAAVWTLTLYHFTKEQEDTAAFATERHAPAGTQSAFITPRMFWATNALAAGVACVTMLLFFVIPRIGAGLTPHALGGKLRTTGFTEHVELGVMGSVKQDPSVVMRVELKQEPTPGQEPLYLRGRAYDRYTGTSWSNGLLHRRNLPEPAPGHFTTRVDAGRAAPRVGPEIRQEIILEALDTTVLFGAPHVASLSGDFTAVQSDHMNVLYVPVSLPGQVQYVVYSRPPRLTPAETVAVRLSYPESVRRQYLQLPPLSPEVAHLANRVVQGSRTPYESVILIRQHLLKNYRYSLDIAPDRSAHPLEDFLFTQKTGYCEHYATAMVVMLRTIGLPARLVTGFLASEWNGFGHYYTVRQRDAHAWVEVYFPESGWVTFDPTPPDATAELPRWWERVAGAWGSIRLQWDRLIIQYSGKDQLSVVQEVRERREAFQSHLSSAIAARARLWLAFIGNTVSQLSHMRPALEVGIVLLTGCLVFIWLVMKRRGESRRHRAGDASPHMQAVWWYQGMLRIAAARGLTKPAGKTPNEFARYVETHWADAAPHISRLTHLYCRARFGRQAMTPEDRVDAEAILRTLHLKNGRKR